MTIEFRKKALEKLSRPDDLDRLMPVTDSKGWIALLAAGVFLLAVCGWGFLGRINTLVYGDGITLSQGDIRSVAVRTGGVLTGLSVTSGDPVRKGQVLAVVEQPELKQRFLDAFSEYEFLRSQEHEQREYFEQQITLLEERKEKVLKRHQKGLVDKSQVHTASQRLMETKNRLYDFNRSLASARRRLAGSRENYKWKSAVFAPLTGRVLEVEFNNGENITAGSELLHIEPYDYSGDSLEVRLDLYFQSGDAKQIQKGMEAYVALSTVSSEKYGYVIGKVIAVSRYPKSIQSITADVKNEQLAALFADTSPPYKVTVKLHQDSTSPSGYLWTSGKGPDISISSGMLCRGRVVVSKQRPVDLVIPMLTDFALGN